MATKQRITFPPYEAWNQQWSLLVWPLAGMIYTRTGVTFVLTSCSQNKEAKIKPACEWKGWGLLSTPEQQGATVLTVLFPPQTVSDRREPHSQMVSVLVGLGVPMWGHVVKDSILSGWGSHFTHDADIGEGLTDGQSCEEALFYPSLAPGPPALQGQHHRGR